jgi:hypothetical protein
MIQADNINCVKIKNLSFTHIRLPIDNQFAFMIIKLTKNEDYVKNHFM